MTGDYRHVEIFGMTDTAAQEAVLHALRAHNDLTVEATESGGKPMVTVRCLSPWRASSVASRVAALDPGSILIRTSSEMHDGLAV